MSQSDIDEIIHSYFTQKNILIKHQIESFDYYIDHIIPDIEAFHEAVTCAMATESYLTGRRVEWDPVKRRLI